MVRPELKVNRYLHGFIKWEKDNEGQYKEHFGKRNDTLPVNGAIKGRVLL